MTHQDAAFAAVHKATGADLALAFAAREAHDDPALVLSDEDRRKVALWLGTLVGRPLA